MIAAWLRAGVIDQGRFAPTEDGSPQGGVISPLLIVALHGMEQAAGVRYIRTGTNAETARSGSPVLIRYADDLLALCHSREHAQQVKARLTEWLRPRGLVFNEDKTRIVHLEDGVDFLGFNIRRYRQQAADQTQQGGRETDPGTADHRDASTAGPQRPDGAHPAQPDHSGVVGLLPALRVGPGVQCAGQSRVEAHRQVGQIHPSAQGTALDRVPLLRRVPPVPARPLGIR
ncbi:hypothetical protein LAUMK142_05253 [Mycobacterium pseudokansasii]|uniref:Reverse transcriptase domain-containing protein n=1 Tax=Mycobacterium pseudokansasii TaxID=2341080 RepID=A0A498QYZ6_9MYCO|nr:hypothetical protein LAUMK142_05253 [Mycobacterium pseudokansasii]